MRPRVTGRPGPTVPTKAVKAAKAAKAISAASGCRATCIRYRP
jgi:hypothetical protein